MSEINTNRNNYRSTLARKSYRRTAAGSGILALAGLSALVYIGFGKLTLPGAGFSLALLGWWLLALALLLSETLAAFVLAGALVCLRRDSLEARGLPYAGRPREWHAGPVARGVRSLLRKLRSTQRDGSRSLALHAGEWVEVLSREEIIATLDSRGELDSLPFMPEMEPFCGRKARVFRRVDKIFDWIRSTGLRRMHDTVILEGLRCDGKDHGGCQADCPMLWKEAWLRRVGTRKAQITNNANVPAAALDLRKFTTRIDPETSETRFVCQLCKVPEATTPTPWSSPRNLFRELSSGNVRIGPFLTFICILIFNFAQRRTGGLLFPVLLHSGSPSTPRSMLNLQPGELVRIKSKGEIEETLDSQFKNRGLWFDKEMTRFCGGQYKVRARVDRQIDERTGKMVNIKTPCITLEDVTATGEYFEFAPLDERIYWREIWLERAGDHPSTAPHDEALDPIAGDVRA